jgi:hypothetical protein
MGSPKKDAFYFPHDAGARNDSRIMAMRTVYGAEGYAWYFMILEIMREQTDYRLPNNKYVFDALAMQLQCDRNAIEKFINNCATEFKDSHGSLLSINEEFIWSESFLNRMNAVEIKREQSRSAANSRWEKTKKSRLKNADVMRQ